MQLNAAFSLAKASLITMLRSPTSVVFSLLFPIIFIVVFGSMVDNTVIQLKISLAPKCDTANVIYQSITKMSNITIDSNLHGADAVNALQKGRLTAIVDIKKDRVNLPVPHYMVSLTSSTSSRSQAELLQTLLNNAITSINQNIFPNDPSIALVKKKELAGRVTGR